ncbi:MAG: tRNA lysidine(34) synthetase TilS [Microcoleus sp. SU_5_3]|nr:tRNA lysidine(34) synthetase TilS [Microcoleus sp. SU_5_3]NJL67055.1 tRNA lysidine(34) synthetase TilS [Microcoleus sp. SM1_3_4]
MSESSKWTHLHAQLHRTLLHRQILPKKQRLLVAVSGGQDSLCSIKLLLDLRSKWDWEIAIAHCDHRWRPDSEANANHVQNLAENWGVPFYLATADIPPKTEAAARSWRYQALAKIAVANNYSYIITGHTASDRAETLLYNLIRGTGIDGLSSLTWKRPLEDFSFDNSDDFRLGKADCRLGNSEISNENLQSKIQNLKSKIHLVRPLLEITRAQTGQFCQEQKLPIWEDSTNQNLQYRRNRIRSELLPYLETHFNPKTQQALAQTAEILRADVEYLELAASDLLKQAMSQIGDSESINEPVKFQLPIELNRQILRQAHLALQRRAMRQLLQQILPEAPSFASIEKLTYLIAAPNKSQTDPFPGGAIARVEHPAIILDIC